MYITKNVPFNHENKKGKILLIDICDLHQVTIILRAPTGKHWHLGLVVISLPSFNKAILKPKLPLLVIAVIAGHWFLCHSFSSATEGTISLKLSTVFTRLGLTSISRAFGIEWHP